MRHARGIVKGIDTPKPRWAYGWYCKIGKKSYIVLDDAFIQAYEDSPGTEHIEGFVEVIPETTGQYTGLKDKNGVKIYKGDIIRYMDGKAMEVFHLTKDNYAGWHLRRKPDHNRAGMTIYGFYDHSKYPNAHEEVIGNIHQNPELLK